MMDSCSLLFDRSDISDTSRPLHVVRNVGPRKSSSLGCINAEDGRQTN
jgi:hypothetical protein